MITQQELIDILQYDPNTGEFRWKVDCSTKCRKGAIAGSYTGHGYRRIRIDKKEYRAHRLAWLYMTGNWPKDQLDHINGIRDDNCWTNLREASHSENAQNRKCAGVTLDKRHNKWQAKIGIGKKYKHIGLYTTKEEAHAAYLEAKKQLHVFNPIPRI